jgi:hypothetical protein
LHEIDAGKHLPLDYKFGGRGPVWQRFTRRPLRCTLLRCPQASILSRQEEADALLKKHGFDFKAYKWKN